ncbi:MAG: helix-turn-helix domain-containing protein [Bacteroidota bacterium]
MFILKQLRRKKNISQTDLAHAIGVSLRTIQLYERKDANIPNKNLTKIAQYFDVTISQLYAGEVNETDIIYDKQSGSSAKSHEIRKLGPGKYLLSAPLITLKEKEGYIKNYGASTFLDTRSKVGFVVDQVSVAHYTAFEISNNSMDNGQVNGIPQKAIVLGKLVKKKELKRKLRDFVGAYWIIVYRESIMCKEILAYDKKNGTILCHSLNDSPEFPDFELRLEEIKQLFMIIKKQVD